MSTVDDDPRLDKPWDVLMDALAEKANALVDGREPVIDEDLVQQASVIVVGGFFVQHGVSIDTVERLFTERPFTVKLCYERDTDEIDLTIEWDDHENPEICWRCDSAPSTTNVGLCEGCLDTLREE